MDYEDRREEGSKLLRSNKRLSFDKWQGALRHGKIGIQDGNSSQRWAYRDGYFVELNEYEDYLNGHSHADNPRSMDRRFFENLNTRGRRLVLTTAIQVGGE